MPFRDSHSCPILVADHMNNSLPNLANLPPDAQAYIVEQSALLAARDADILGLKQEVLGLTLNHAADQKRLKSKATTAQAALLTERTAHAQTIQSRDVIIADLRMQLDGHKKHRFGSRSESSNQLA